MRLVLAAAVAAAAAAAPPAPPAQQQLLHQLEQCASALPSGQDPFREQASLATARLFLNYSAVDRTHINFIASSLASFHGNGTPNASDLAVAAKLPQHEVDGVGSVLRAALDECRAVRNGTLRRPAAPDMAALGPLRVNPTTGFLRDERSQRPVFLYGYSQAPQLEASTSAITRPLAVTFNDVYFTPAHILDPEACCGTDAKAIQDLGSSLDSTAAAGAYAQIFIGNGNNNGAGTVEHAFPAWAQTLYPNISDGAGKQHFYSYDIDHPGTRHLLSVVLDAVVPAVAGHPGSIGWSLANEPGFSSSNSEYTYKHWVEFLRERYNGRCVFCLFL